MIGQGLHSTNQRHHDYVKEGRTVGFYTDPTVCIGCKACEVACKGWNQVPADGLHFYGESYDNTGALWGLDVAARCVPRTGHRPRPADRGADDGQGARRREHERPIPVVIPI